MSRIDRGWTHCTAIRHHRAQADVTRFYNRSGTNETHRGEVPSTLHEFWTVFFS